jgi:uncharacterized protein
MQHFSIEPQIQVTLNCNMACNYCFQQHQGSIVDLAIVERIVAQLADFHRRQYRYCEIDQPLLITWHGGEPLLAGIDFYSRVIEIENRYPDLRFDNRLQTNGTLLTVEYAKFFARHGFNVGFSLDGPASLNNVFRHYRHGFGNPFVDAIRGLERYRRYAKPEQIPVIAVITPVTIKRVESFYRFFKSLNTKVQLDIYDLCAGELLDPSGNTSGVSDYAPDNAGIGEFLIRLFDLWFNDASRKVEFSDLRNEVKMILQPEMSSGDPFHKKRCAPGRLIFDPQGRAFSCDQYVNDARTALGNIKEDSLEDILDRKFRLWDEIKHHVRGSTEQMACARCEWGQQCAGGCLTCMKYNAMLLQARQDGLPDSHWYEARLPKKLRDLSGETYYCDGLRHFREHAKAAVARELNHA